MKKTASLALAALGLVAGCAGIEAPTKHLANAQSDLRAAETVGVDGVPKAALHLQLAREELEKAKHLMDDKKNEQAEYMLRRAEVDSALAIVLSKNLPLEEKAKAVRDQLEQLKPSLKADDNTTKQD